MKTRKIREKKQKKRFSMVDVIVQKGRWIEKIFAIAVILSVISACFVHVNYDLSLLHEAPDMPEQQKEKYVKVALNKAERLEKLINELFEITKYNAHTVIIKKENIDLHCLIAQVIDEIYPTLSANGNTAVFTAEDNLSVNADPEKLARVFSNLLRNAASYSYPQTEITIFAKRLEHDIQITFENHGKTIPQEQLNSIFEKFNRLDEARLSNTGGAGLGLSIAEEIIHLHGGTITAFSQNETIDFVITLPLSA